MNKELTMRLCWVITATLIFGGCAPAVQIGAGLIGEGIGDSMSSKGKRPNELYDLIERYEVGDNVVTLHNATNKYRPGYLFTAWDRNRQVLGRIFCAQDDENAMKKYNEFLRMDNMGKINYVYERFLSYGVDLGPIETGTVSSESQ